MPWWGLLLSIPQVTLHLLGDTGWHTNAQRLNELILLCREKQLKEADGRKGQPRQTPHSLSPLKEAPEFSYTLSQEASMCL